MFHGNKWSDPRASSASCPSSDSRSRGAHEAAVEEMIAAPLESVSRAWEAQMGPQFVASLRDLAVALVAEEAGETVVAPVEPQVLAAVLEREVVLAQVAALGMGSAMVLALLWAAPVEAAGPAALAKKATVLRAVKALAACPAPLSPEVALAARMACHLETLCWAAESAVGQEALVAAGQTCREVFGLVAQSSYSVPVLRPGAPQSEPPAAANDEVDSVPYE